MGPTQTDMTSLQLNEYDSSSALCHTSCNGIKGNQGGANLNTGSHSFAIYYLVTKMILNRSFLVRIHSILILSHCARYNSATVDGAEFRLASL